MAVPGGQGALDLFHELVRVANGAKKDWQALAAVRSPRRVETLTGSPIDEEGARNAEASRASEESAATSAYGRRVETSKKRSDDLLDRTTRAETLPVAAMERLGLKELPAVEPLEADAGLDPNVAIADFERHSKAVVARSATSAGAPSGLPRGRIALVAGAVVLVVALIALAAQPKSNPYAYSDSTLNAFAAQTTPPDLLPTQDDTSSASPAPTDTPISTAVPSDAQPSLGGPSGSQPTFTLTTGLPYSGSAGNGGVQVVIMTH